MVDNEETGYTRIVNRSRLVYLKRNLSETDDKRE